MNYKELQNEAKALGIKYVGVSEADLKIKVEESSVKEEETSGEIKETEKEIETIKPLKKSKKKTNVAIVSNKGQEIRRYTVDIHGKDFAKLAKSFAEPRDYVVRLVKSKSSIKCPDCGAIIDDLVNV